jgi:hypothetical protein
MLYILHFLLLFRSMRSVFHFICQSKRKHYRLPYQHLYADVYWKTHHHRYYDWRPAPDCGHLLTLQSQSQTPGGELLLDSPLTLLKRNTVIKFCQLSLISSSSICSGTYKCYNLWFFSQIIHLTHTHIYNLTHTHCILQTIRHNKISEGKFGGKYFIHILSSN